MQSLQSLGFMNEEANRLALISVNCKVGLAIDVLSSQGEGPHHQPPNPRPQAGLPPPAAVVPGRFQSQLEQLRNMGFQDDAKSLRALEQHSGNVEQSVDWLFQNM